MFLHLAYINCNTVVSSRDESDSDSSDSSDDEGKIEAVIGDDGDDESDNEGPKKQNPTSQVATKNEILNPEVKLPAISEVDPSEILELAGEISSVVDSVVIVRGLERHERQPEAADRVLDTDSLLVFDDRKVLGLVSSLSSSRESQLTGEKGF